MRSTLLAGTAAGILACATLAIPAHALSDSAADLSVLHGVPDTPVDVWVNGALTLDDFQPGALARPLEMPAGTYSIAATEPGVAADALEPAPTPAPTRPRTPRPPPRR